MLVLGINSGTSMDGVVTALIDVEEEAGSVSDTQSPPKLKVKLIGVETTPYPQGVKEELLRFSESRVVQELCNFHFYLGKVFAQSAINAMRTFGQDIEEVGIIGTHGQTIRHFPHGLKGYKYSTPSSHQLGEVDVVSAQTGVTSVGDFHGKDIALGGEGAPGIFSHCVLFRHPELTRGILNLGGIANISYLPPGTGTNNVVAFDTGPANMIIDGLMDKISGGELQYDKDGEVASKGQVYQPLLAWLMRHPFIQRKPPKSTGRQEFGRHYVEEILDRGRKTNLCDEDLIATVTRFTIESIVLNLTKFLNPMDELILSGGGARNKTILYGLTERMHGTKVTTTEEYGIPLESVEPIGIALKAYATSLGRPSSFRAVTGAKRDSIAGKISPILGKFQIYPKNPRRNM